MAAKQHQEHHHHHHHHQHQQQQQQQQMVSSRFMGLSQEYPPLATAASYSSATNRKWVLNSKNDVVELGDGSPFHHQQQDVNNPPPPPPPHPGSHPPPPPAPGHFLESAGAPPPAGFMAATDGRLMRYNSAPSCLFSDLDQIARSLNDSSAQLFPAAAAAAAAAADQQQQLPPLPGIIDKRNHHHLLEMKKKNHPGGGGAASSSRFSTAQSSVVLDFDQGEHHTTPHCSNGFTGLLTGSSTTTTTATTTTTTNNNTTTNNLLKGSPGGSLARQSSSPASLLSRLEIEHGTGTTGSSEEDSPLMRSPMNDQDHEQPGGMGSECGFWDGNAGNVAAAVAAVQHAHHVAAAAQAALHHQHQQQHQQQQQQQQQQMHGVFLSNENSTGETRKRIRDVEMDIVEAAAMDHHNQQQQQQHTLTRHLSLPISTRSGGGLLAAENLLQDSVPCRLRAKRGCATHPRSIAERVRRTRISERMRRLQELVPNMDKQTNMSDMLDEAAEYMKFLQKKVEELEECREKCQGLCKMSQSGASTHLS